MAENDDVVYGDACIVNEMNMQKVDQYEIPEHVIPNQRFFVVITNVIFATEDKVNAMKLKNKYAERKEGRVIGIVSGDDVISAIKVVKDKKVGDIDYVLLSPRMGLRSLGKALEHVKRLWKIEIDRRLLAQNYVFLDIEKKDMKVFTVKELDDISPEDGWNDVAFVCPK